MTEVRVVKRGELTGGVMSGGLIRVQAISATTVGSMGLFMGLARVPPGLRGSPRVQTKGESAFYAASGRGRFLTGRALEHSLEVEPGDFIYLPTDAPHAVVNDGDVDLLLVAVRTLQEEQVADYDPDAGEPSGLKTEVRVVKRADLMSGVRSGGMVRSAAISAETVGSQGVFMGRASIPPGLRSSPHVHTNCESALYAAAGRGRFLTGERLEHSLEVEPGDFIHVPADAPHVVVNDGDVDFLLVVCRDTQEERVAEYDPDAAVTTVPPAARARLDRPLLADRCKTCHVRIRGSMSIVSRLRGIRPYRKNPQLCSRCESRIKGAEDRVVTALFADIRGSTELTHERSSAELLRVLQQFFHTAADVAYDHYGMVDRFLGDGILVFFNVPAPRMTHSEDAVKAAIGIEDALKDAPFGVGIGIESGMAMTGNIGVGDVCDFTCVGEPVNVASRLQSLAGPGEIVIGPTAWRQAADLIETRGIPCQAETVELKGVGLANVWRIHPVSRSGPPPGP